MAGVLQEGDTAFDFLGPVQEDSIMQQVAEGKSSCISLLGHALRTAYVAFISPRCATHAVTYVGGSCAVASGSQLRLGAARAFPKPPPHPLLSVPL